MDINLSINNAREGKKNNQQNSDFKIKTSLSQAFNKSLKNGWPLYLLLVLPITYIIVFHYIPMAGVLLAFKEFEPVDGFLSGRWVGFENFKMFFESYNFWRLIQNTLLLNLYQLVVAFPIPIILAISINEVKNRAFRKSVQLITYAPHFISMVITISIFMQVLSVHSGVVNTVIKMLGNEPINFMGDPAYFRSIFVWSGVWHNAGYSSIVYIAALAGIDPELYEAAIVDGANKINRIIHIDIPGILPTAIVLLILNVGHMMNVGFEKVFLLQNSMNIQTSEVISTYVYKAGLIRGDFSFATAVGFFNSVINLSLVYVVNRLARKYSDTSLW